MPLLPSQNNAFRLQHSVPPKTILYTCYRTSFLMGPKYHRNTVADGALPNPARRAWRSSRPSTCIYGEGIRSREERERAAKMDRKRRKGKDQGKGHGRLGKGERIEEERRELSPCLAPPHKILHYPGRSPHQRQTSILIAGTSAIFRRAGGALSNHRY